jgi:hypothetical protein
MEVSWIGNAARKKKTPDPYATRMKEAQKRLKKEIDEMPAPARKRRRPSPKAGVVPVRLERVGSGATQGVPIKKNAPGDI